MDQQTADYILKVTQKTTVDTTTTTDIVLVAVFQENLGRWSPHFFLRVLQKRTIGNKWRPSCHPTMPLLESFTTSSHTTTPHRHSKPCIGFQSSTGSSSGYVCWFI